MGPGSYGGWTPEKSHGWEGEQIPLTRSYFDQEPFVMPVDGSKIILRNRKISTYVNAMAKAGSGWREILAHYYTGAELQTYG